MLSNWSGLHLVVPFPRTLTPPYLSLSSLSVAGMNPTRVSWLGKCGWNPPSEAKVAETSVLKFFPFSTVHQCALWEKCAGNFNLNNTWNGVAETYIMPALVDVTLRRIQPGPWGFRMQVFHVESTLNYHRLLFLQAVFRIRKYFIRIRDLRIHNPELWIKGGQWITNPDPTWTFLWITKKHVVK